MALTQEQIDFFHVNGYLPYGPLLDAERTELLGREYDAEFAKAREDGGGRNLAEDEVKESGQGQANGGQAETATQMLQLMQMCERNIEFRRLIFHETILDIVQDLIGPNIMLFHDQALYKPAHTGGAVYWHQDNAYWKCRPATLLSCWLTFDDVDIDNGAMQVIPGSHLKPLWHEKSESTVLLDVEKHIDTSSAVAVPLPAGGCMFHHCQTLHYTAPNTTARRRRAFAMHFMQPGTRSENIQPGEGPLRAGFNRPVLRQSI